MTPEHSTYLALIDAGHAHGITGRPDAAEANRRRSTLGLAAADARPYWTPRRLERLRDQAIDWLDTALLRPGPAPTSPADQARAVLALADIPVRDSFLVRAARADPAAQTRLADRLAPIAQAAPAELRQPVGTVLAVTEWLLGRPGVPQRIDWATNHGRQPYALAALVGQMIDAGIPTRVFVDQVIGRLTEADCRHPGSTRTAAVDPVVAAGQAMTQRGWALHVEQQFDLGHAIAWSGTLTHHGTPVAHLAHHGDDTGPHLHWPHGSPHQQTWADDLIHARATPAAAVAALDHVAASNPDPLATQDPGWHLAGGPTPTTGGPGRGPAEPAAHR